MTALVMPLSAQQKYEKESRLKEKEVPANALAFIKDLKVKKKVKWYLEESLNGKSVEAKFKYNKQKFSIEFDLNGQLEDVEIKVKWKSLKQAIRHSIENELAKDCKPFKIRKVQVQYSGEQTEVLSKILNGTGNYTTRYEIVVKCTHADGVDLYEYLFDDEGKKIKASQIIFKNSSNLEY